MEGRGTVLGKYKVEDYHSVWKNQEKLPKRKAVLKGEWGFTQKYEWAREREMDN